MFLECLKNNSKILSDVIIMQFGKGVLLAEMLANMLARFTPTFICLQITYIRVMNSFVLSEEEGFLFILRYLSMKKY